MPAGRFMYRMRQKRARDGHTYFLEPHPACPYCKRVFVSDRGCAQHLARDDLCREKEEAAIQRYIQARSQPQQPAASSEVANDAPSPTHWGPWTYSTNLTSTDAVGGDSGHLSNNAGDLVGENEDVTLRMPPNYVEYYPNRNAGAALAGEPIEFDLAYYIGSSGPFTDPKVFEAAELLVSSNMTNKERTAFLKSELYEGQVPWPDCRLMMQDIDILPRGPDWSLHTFVVDGLDHTYVLHAFKRDVIQVVRELIGNPALQSEMRFAPERQWTSIACLERIYNEMWTGDWWWEMQARLEKELDEFGTIAALIISSDKTCVSKVMGSKYVYPVFVTLGNISKQARRRTSNRAMVLLGYLPVESFKDEPKAKRPRLRQQLIQRAMATLLEPLREAWKQGVEMMCCDGRIRRVHPTLAAFEGDWPEQCDLANTLASGCPKCDEEPEHRGDLNETTIRDPNATLAALMLYDSPGILGKYLWLRPGWPFWANLYPTNFHDAIMPDLLHQVYIGIYRDYFVSWAGKALGKKSLDKRFAAMSEAPGLRRFPGGISSVGRWTGRESKEMAKVILPILADTLSGSPMKAVVALLNFCYLVHSASLSNADLKEMVGYLEEFHQHKDSIRKAGWLGPRGFHALAKLHMISHYFLSICRFGVPDGYLTETSEYLHIEFAKIPWLKSGRRDDCLPHIIRYLGRREAIRIHRTHMDKFYRPKQPVSEVDRSEEPIVKENGDWVDVEDEPSVEDFVGGVPQSWVRSSFKPRQRRLFNDVVERNHEAVGPPRVLQHHLSARADSEDERRLIESLTSEPFTVDIWHRVRIYHRPLPFARDEPPKVDSIRALSRLRSRQPRKVILRAVPSTTRIR